MTRDELKDLIEWINSDNVIKVLRDGNKRYLTQCTQYFKPFTKDELKKYFKREYLS